MFYLSVELTYTGWQDSYVSGWGTKQFRGNMTSGPPEKVQHVIVDDQDCKNTMKHIQKGIGSGIEKEQ